MKQHLLKIRRKITGFIHRHVREICKVLGFKALPTRLNGKWVFVDIEMWHSIRINYEIFITEALNNTLNRGDVFFDVGANQGLLSSYSAKLVGNEGRVLAFEPSPAYQSLQIAADYDDCIEVYNIGLGEEESELVFFALDRSTTGSFVEDVSKLDEDNAHGIPITEHRVRLSTIDLVIEELKVVPTVIKVDVEGFEVKVLKGSLNTLSKHACIWIIEIHPPQITMSDDSEEELLCLLKKNDYSIKVIDNRNVSDIYTILAKKRTIDLIAELYSFR